MGNRKTDPAFARDCQTGWLNGADFQCLPGESADARWHRKHPPTRRRQVQGPVDAYFFHQWNAASGSLVDRRHGQGDRPLSQGLTRVFGLSSEWRPQRGPRYFFRGSRKVWKTAAGFGTAVALAGASIHSPAPTPNRAWQVPERSSESSGTDLA